MAYARAEALLRLFKRPQWFRSKTGITGATKRPFIFPTGFGFAFGSLAFVQLMMAIASQNNLIYLFVFAEISIALASMFYTNLNIHRVQLDDIKTSDCFAQETNWVEIYLKTLKDKPIYQTSVRWNFEKTGLSLPPNTLFLSIPWTPKRRGLQKVPALTVESSYPFGLLRSWKIQRFHKEVLVLPCRRGNTNFPASSIGNNAVDNQGLFYDLRQFQRGDWPRRIDWRASQRAQKLLIRRFEEESSMQLEFSWNDTAHISNGEGRISQLALWVDKAEKQNSEYSLRVGAWNSGRGRGHGHWLKCMEHLALLSLKGLK